MATLLKDDQLFSEISAVIKLHQFNWLFSKYKPDSLNESAAILAQDNFKLNIHLAFVFLNKPSFANSANTEDLN